MAFLAEHSDGYDYVPTHPPALLDRGGNPGTLTLANAFLEDESAVLQRAAEQRLARKDVALVVMGHTHEPSARPNGVMYYNTGCWTRNYTLQPGLQHSWKFLSEAHHAHFPYTLTYLEIPSSCIDETRFCTHKPG